MFLVGVGRQQIREQQTFQVNKDLGFGGIAKKEDKFVVESVRNYVLLDSKCTVEMVLKVGVLYVSTLDILKNYRLLSSKYTDEIVV